jgi:hypothetical protein
MTKRWCIVVTMCHIVGIPLKAVKLPVLYVCCGAGSSCAARALLVKNVAVLENAACKLA